MPRYLTDGETWRREPHRSRRTSVRSNLTNLVQTIWVFCELGWFSIFRTKPTITLIRSIGLSIYWTELREVTQRAVSSANCEGWVARSSGWVINILAEKDSLERWGDGTLWNAGSRNVHSTWSSLYSHVKLAGGQLVADLPSKWGKDFWQIWACRKAPRVTACWMLVHCPER